MLSPMHAKARCDIILPSSEENLLARRDPKLSHTHDWRRRTLEEQSILDGSGFDQNTRTTEPCLPDNTTGTSPCNLPEQRFGLVRSLEDRTGCESFF